MKEAKQNKCEKCKKHFYVHDHHILPKSIFGNGETISLCPSCHTHYHEYLKKQNIDTENIEQNLFVWYKWFHSVPLILLALISIWFFWL